MSNPEPPTNEPPELNIKDKKTRKDTTRKKKSALSDHQDNGGNKFAYKDKQMLLTNFMKNKRTNNQSNTSTNSTIEFLSPPTNKEIILEEELKKKNQIIQKLQDDKQKQLQKTNKIKFQYNELTSKTKKAIIESKKELAHFMRKQRGRINAQFGFYKEYTSSTFIQGDYLLTLKGKIGQLQALINDIQADKSKSKEENFKLSQSSRAQFYKKQHANLKFQLQIRTKQMQIYKQKLRLYNKEINCIFAKDNWPLIKNRYQPLQLVGNGGFGEVYRGFDVQKFQDVAIKVHIMDTRLSSSSSELCIKYLKRQIQIHKALEHPNIVKMIDQLDLDGNKLGIVMQYCSGPELKSYLRKEGCLDERQAKQIIKQVIYAVKYLHDQKYKIIHYDLKPANILFHHGVVKVVDFGISKKLENDDTNIELTTPGLGTYWYLPPEVFQDNHPKVSSKVDVWSIGVIYYEMLYGKKPFGHGMNQPKILAHNVIINSAKNLEFPQASPKKYKISDQAKQFIQACLKYTADERLSPLQAYEHEYIKF